MKLNRNAFGNMEDFYESLENAEKICACDLKAESTVLVIVDVINGFIREGVMADSGIAEIILPVKKCLSYCVGNGISVIAFADCHSENAAEFEAFPHHCIKGESESEIVCELKETGGYTLIEKNSTNGFHAPDFRKFLAENENKTEFVVCGDCTDICVMNFCLSLKTYFDQINKRCSITVPLDMTQTYDANGHNRDFMNAAALLFMKNAGIKIVGGIDYEK